MQVVAKEEPATKLLAAVAGLALPRDVPVMFVQPLENHVSVLEALAFDRSWAGASPAAVKAVRDPLALSQLPVHKGLRFPKVRTSASLLTRAGQRMAALFGGRGYLLKPRFGSGGEGVSHWGVGQRVGRDAYLQQFIKGIPMSVVYLADGWSAHLLGATEMLVGDSAFGAEGFGYVGSVGPMALGDTLRKALMHLGVVLTQRFDLRGVFGVDGVMDFAGNFWPVEVNPRYTNSVEVLERATGVSLLERWGLGDTAGKRKGRAVSHEASHVSGSAIVYAKRAMVMPEAMGGIEGALADVAVAGETVAAGEAICTVFADAATRDACVAMLRHLAGRVYEVVGEA